MQGGTTSTTRGSLAFRIVGWLLGVLSIGFWLFFAIVSLLSGDLGDRIHRFHNVAGLAGGGLIGLFSILLVMRPDRISMFHAVAGQVIVWVIAGLMGGDLLGGGYVFAIVGLVLLVALHPDRRSLGRLPGRPSVAMLTYGLIVTVPAWIYAVTMAELQHGPATDPHVEFHHWSAMAVTSLGIAAAAIAASLRGTGWALTAAIAAAAAVLFGLAGLVFPDDPGAPGVGWSWIAIAAGVGFWLLARIEATREPPRS